MKIIGLLGGMSWESTAVYYRVINEYVTEKFGDFHSAKIILNSLEFHRLEKMMQAENWLEIEQTLIENAKKVERGGADFLLICSNTMHKLAPKIQESINIPIVHIANATAEELQKNSIKKVGLLGTTFTMEQDFYKDILTEKYGLKVVVPDQADRKIVHRIIDEICMGNYFEQSRQEYLRIIDKLAAEGCEAVILGCTEIGILIKQSHSEIPLFDTTIIHARAAVELAIKLENI